MKQFLQFCLNHYEIIVSVFSVFLVSILTIVKKRPSSSYLSELKLTLNEKLPELIKNAEALFLGDEPAGSTKLEIVVQSSLEFLSRKLGRTLKSTERAYFKAFIIENVESILSTPQKKEDIKCLEEE